MRVVVDPGVCGLKTVIETEGKSKKKLTVKVTSMCKHVQDMCDAIGTEVSPLKICCSKLGKDPYSEWAQDPANGFPPHASCPTIAGIIKAIEAASGMGLPGDCSIVFTDTSRE